MGVPHGFEGQFKNEKLYISKAKETTHCLSNVHQGKRPDIAYVVVVVSQFMHAPLEDHLEVVMRILRYLKATPDMSLLFSKNGHMKGFGGGALQPEPAPLRSLIVWSCIGSWYPRRRTNELRSDMDIPEEVIMKFKQFWSDFKDTPLKGRNAILRGICPQVFGLFTVKLAVALTLIGGVQHVDASGTKVRGESHLLLVGDPGTGKSQFLKFAAKLSNRSVITTGFGSTSAGLTVTAVKDGGKYYA
ncbi:putative DNA helicase MCM9 [Vitis vinifera]|uniref:Putative DNA helicase MCM9 n=1 Tax=Vitis vinifera TaxID=29760 RepID=A0A438FWQ6_VITVI|nr:putative DNA helicase MCM9 [Vitis vinifera]